MSEELPATVIGKERVQTFLFDQGIPYEAIRTPWLYYAMPSRRWFFGAEAMDVVGAALVRANLDAWKAGPSVCYNFTEVAVAEYHLQHRISRKMPPGSASLVGAFEFIPDSQARLPRDVRQGHSIVFAMTSPDHGVTLELVFLDAQTMTERTTSLEERNSCQKADLA